MKGVPIGYNHDWTYKLRVIEEKLSDGIWGVHTTGTKTRFKPMKYPNYYKIGHNSTFKWHWEGNQIAIKIDPNSYSLEGYYRKTYKSSRILTPNTPRLSDYR